MKGNITLAEAKRLSLIKWESIVEHGITILHPELINIKFECGFCERWKNIDNYIGYRSFCDCGKCEFAKELNIKSCQDEDGLFMKWHKQYKGYKAMQYAQEILEHIKNIKITEE